MLTYSDEQNEITSVIYKHQYEVTHLAPSPTRADLFWTCDGIGACQMPVDINR
jgi:hypothetical protein